MANWILPTALAVFACLAMTAVESRNTCSLDTRPCLEGEQSSCQEGTCKCNAGYRGIGQLRCVPSDRYVCTILNDPKGTPFSGGKSADIALPCRYLATDVTVEIPTAPDFWCRSRVFAYGWRFNGKIFLIGYDIRVDWEGNGLDRYTFTLKAYGKKDADGNYNWDLLTRHSRWLGGDTWQREDISVDVMDDQLGGDNFFGIDPVNNRVRFSSSVCGIDTAFRLPDPTAGSNQPDLPGLFVSVNPNAGEVIFNDVEGSVCLTPALDAESAAAEVDPALEVDDAFLFKVSAYDRGQSFPRGNTPECTNLATVTAACDNAALRQNALEKCSFILQKPHFLNCYSQDENSGDAVKLFKDCMKAFCNNNGGLCNSVKAQLNAKSDCKDAAAEAEVLLDTPCSGLLLL